MFYHLKIKIWDLRFYSCVTCICRLMIRYNVAWEISWHFATPLLVSPWNDIWVQSEALPGSGKFLVSLRIPVLVTHSDIISWGNHPVVASWNVGHVCRHIYTVMQQNQTKFQSNSIEFNQMYSLIFWLNLILAIE